MSAIARRLRCTEGQVLTAVIGFVIAVALFAIGIPPVLRSDGAASAAPATDSPSTPEPSASTTTTSTATAHAAPTTLQSRAADPSPPADAPAAAAPTRHATSSSAPVGLRRSVIDAGYTSSTAGTPLSGPEVPEDGMPVSVRLGRIDKVSFARLAGTAPNLNLVLVDHQAANQLVALAAVQACAVTEPGWVLDRPGAPPEDGPTYDDQRCSDGIQTPTGAWKFDLADLGELDERAGIALLPIFEGPVTFQITFSTVAVTDTEAGT